MDDEEAVSVTPSGAPSSSSSPAAKTVPIEEVDSEEEEEAGEVMQDTTPASTPPRLVPQGARQVLGLEAVVAQLLLLARGDHQVIVIHHLFVLSHCRGCSSALVGLFPGARLREGCPRVPIVIAAGFARGCCKCESRQPVRWVPWIGWSTRVLFGGVVPCCWADRGLDLSARACLLAR